MHKTCKAKVPPVMRTTRRFKQIHQNKQSEGAFVFLFFGLSYGKEEEYLDIALSSTSKLLDAKKSTTFLRTY